MQLHECSLLEAAALVKSRQVSPVELLNAALERIDACEPQINAFITVMKAEARISAKEHEGLIKSGTYLGPLHGVPLGIKDNIHTAGVRTTAGSAILRNFLPEANATAVACLESAGAVILGKTNMHEFAWGPTNDNQHFGAAHNPWDTRRIPGGSSGGSGAAVAARECYGALGTDTGGSIRLPASLNGVTGLRPTSGLVSNHNVIPLAWSLDTVGPIARDVGDCAAILQAIAGHDVDDPLSSRQPIPDYLTEMTRGIDRMTIGVLTGPFFSHVQAPVRNAVLEALHVLEREGASIAETTIVNPELDSPAQLAIEFTESNLYHQPWLKSRGGEYAADVRAKLERGATILATEYVRAQRHRIDRSRELSQLLGHFDALILPTVPCAAPLIGDDLVTIDANNGKEPLLSVIMRFTQLASLAGLPAISIPCGFTGDGLPIGIQVVGRQFNESTILRIGAAFQAVTDWHRRVPLFSSRAVADSHDQS